MRPLRECIKVDHEHNVVSLSLCGLLSRTALTSSPLVAYLVSHDDGADFGVTAKSIQLLAPNTKLDEPIFVSI